MSRLILLGDSNIYRNITADRISKRVNMSTSIIQATRQQSFELGLKSVGEPCEILIVSTLPNLACDAFGMSAPKEEEVKTLIHNYATQISGIKVKTIALVPPLFRIVPKWYGEVYQFMLRQMKMEVEAHENLQLLPEFTVSGVNLLADGVHLNVSMGQKFYDYLVNCILDLQKPPSTQEATAKPTETVAEILSILKEQVLPELKENTTTKAKLGALETVVHTRMQEDDLVLSRLSEEADFRWNQAREDRVVVVGLQTTSYPKGLTERKEFLSAYMRPFVEEILGDRVVDYFPKPSYLMNNKVPPFIMRFADSKDCNKFKREAFKKSREYDAFQELKFHPCVTPASRVRIEILRAISRKLTTDEQSGYCPIYGVRPLLHVGPKENGRVMTRETLTFVTAVVRFRHLINVSDLFFAYQTLGDNFTGCLRQTFIVLNEDDRQHSKAERTRQATQTTQRGQKRPPTSQGGPVPKK